VFRRYTDQTFQTKVPHDPNLGFMGPILRAHVSLDVNTQGWNYRLVIDNRWRFSLLFFYRISIRLGFLTIDFQPCKYVCIFVNIAVQIECFGNARFLFLPEPNQSLLNLPKFYPMYPNLLNSEMRSHLLHPQLLHH